MLGRFIKLSLYLMIALSLLGCIIIGWYAYHQLSKPMITSSASIIHIEIKPNASARSLVDNLYTQGLIDNKRLLLQFIKYKGIASLLKIGIYQIQVSESATHLLQRIVDGDALSLSFPIIEGTNQNQVANHLTKADFLNYSPNDWESIRANYTSAEGLLLADTYQYKAGTDAKQLMLRAHTNLTNFLDKTWRTRSPNLPYTEAYQLLIVASILEKETSLADERKIISGIVVNRIRKKMPLQMDPTVIYALGSSYNGKLTHESLTIDSAYNTYRYRGLPPTPIAMVGKESIEAAAHPLFSNYLYFVAKGDGTHVFSETYTEQRKAINQYIHKGQL